MACDKKECTTMSGSTQIWNELKKLRYTGMDNNLKIE